HARVDLRVVERVRDAIGASGALEVRFERHVHGQPHADLTLQARETVKAVELDAFDEDAIGQSLLARGGSVAARAGRVNGSRRHALVPFGPRKKTTLRG